MMCHSGVSWWLSQNLTFFSVASCGWAIVGQRAECFFLADGLGMDKCWL